MLTTKLVSTPRARQCPALSPQGSIRRRTPRIPWLQQLAGQHLGLDDDRRPAAGVACGFRLLEDGSAAAPAERRRCGGATVVPGP
jgi:hypothetical protein